MSQDVVFTMQKLRKAYSGRVVLEDISLSFLAGAKIGVLGTNGAGKSTLLRIIAGRDDQFTGTAEAIPGISVGLLEQEPALDPELDVKSNIERGLGERFTLIARYGELSGKLAESLEPGEMDEVLEEFQRVQDQIDSADAWDLERQLEVAMDALRVPPGEADVTTLSGGERRRVALCRLLLSEPDILLLDEPTNHLDAESVAWLERFLEEYDGTVVAVTHDRYFLDNVAQWILELDRGKGVPYKGNYSGWLEQKHARLGQEEREQKARQRTLERELEWVRMTPKGRQSQNKARLANYQRLLAEEQEQRKDPVVIRLPAAPRLGDLVIEAKHLSKGFGDRLLIDDLSFSLPPAGIVGVIGANGAGKTTLFRMIAGHETPSSGELRVGDTVELAYVDQSRDALDPAKNVWEEISGGMDTIALGGSHEVNSRAYVASFNFTGADQQKPVGQLSGGERNRVHLAKMLAGGGNLILLDEPSNDLDIDTLRALEQALLDFSGCVMVTSHDRWFLDRIATHILAFEGDSQVRWFEGNFDEYEEHRRADLGEEALNPKRLTYRRLSAPR
ncbi:MAG: energy-dependent translational throttle protein EttA [Thermoleophilia bacterium]|nr:energy-dependent translational throttle protein EttA [Thermoleophilia bacterium]MDH3724717.1 energy-dependent translational throttle protein EttA [Thermoleophilia bacterium]